MDHIKEVWWNSEHFIKAQDQFEEQPISQASVIIEEEEEKRLLTDEESLVDYASTEEDQPRSRWNAVIPVGNETDDKSKESQRGEEKVDPEEFHKIRISD